MRHGYEPNLDRWGYTRRVLLFEVCLLILAVLHFSTEDFTRYTPGLPQTLWVSVYFIVVTASGATVRTDDDFELLSLVVAVVVWMPPLLIGLLARRHFWGRGIAYSSQFLRYLIGFMMTTLAVT